MNHRTKAAILSFLLILFWLLPGCTGAETAPSTEATLPSDALEVGNSGYYAESTRTQAQGPDGVAAASFTHRIYTPEHKPAVTLSSTVTGSCSVTQDTSSVTGLTTSLSEAYAEGFTLSEHISGNTATVILYLNQISVCHFQYRVHADGTIEYL